MSVWNDGGPRAGGGRGGQQAGLSRIAVLALADSLISQAVNCPHLPAGCLLAQRAQISPRRVSLGPQQGIQLRTSPRYRISGSSPLGLVLSPLNSLSESSISLPTPPTHLFFSRKAPIDLQSAPPPPVQSHVPSPAFVKLNMMSN